MITKLNYDPQTRTMNVFKNEDEQPSLSFLVEEEGFGDILMGFEGISHLRPYERQVFADILALEMGIGYDDEDEDATEEVDDRAAKFLTDVYEKGIAQMNAKKRVVGVAMSEQLARLSKDERFQFIVGLDEAQDGTTAKELNAATVALLDVCNWNLKETELAGGWVWTPDDPPEIYSVGKVLYAFDSWWDVNGSFDSCQLLTFSPPKAGEAALRSDTLMTVLVAPDNTVLFWTIACG